MEAKTVDRSAVPLEQTWNAQSVFATETEWEAAVAKGSRLIEALGEHAGRLGDSPGNLADYLEAKAEVFRLVSHVWVWAGMNAAVDANDEAAQSRAQRARALYGRAAEAVAFETPELLEIGLDQLREWTVSAPRLADLGHYIERLEHRAPHVRSPEVEALLGAVVDPFGTPGAAHGILANAELRFAPAHSADGTEYEVAQSTYQRLVSDGDRELRSSAWRSYADAHLEHRRTAAACVIGGFKQNVFTARARRYPTALEASLGSNHIPEDVYHTLIATFRSNLPIWHRYWRVRREALGLGALAGWDLRAPLTSKKVEVSANRAMDWIAEGLRPLGDEYVSVFAQGRGVGALGGRLA